jgi:hypothetical protein
MEYPFSQWRNDDQVIILAEAGMRLLQPPNAAVSHGPNFFGFWWLLAKCEPSDRPISDLIHGAVEF